MPEIKIFVSFHKPFPVPDHVLLYPIQVGSALTTERISGFLQDNSGENISIRNRSYCELTAQYWAWKNVKSDYYGFFHYRRYLYPDLNAKRPYRVEGSPTSKLLERLRFPHLAEIVKNHDLIAPKGEDMFLPVREHYARSLFHHQEDLALVERIVREAYPSYAEALDRYLSRSICYFGNIFLMERNLFDRYCTWLFSILNQFDRRANSYGYNASELRVDGYLAERLFGVFYTKCQEESVRSIELPRVDFVEDRHMRAKRKLLSAVLPPGTKRRAMAKRLRCVGTYDGSL